MTNLKNVLSVGLAAAILAAIFPFFAGDGKVLYTSEARPLGCLMNPCTGAGADTSVEGDAA